MSREALEGDEAGQDLQGDLAGYNVTDARPEDQEQRHESYSMRRLARRARYDIEGRLRDSGRRLRLWQEPFVPLRLPKLLTLRSAPSRPPTRGHGL